MPVLVAKCAQIGAFECCFFFLFVITHARSRVEPFCDITLLAWLLDVVAGFEDMTGGTKRARRLAI